MCSSDLTQHFWHKDRIDISPLDAATLWAGERESLHQLGRGAAPHLKIAIGVFGVAKPVGQLAGGIKTGGVTDQAKHGRSRSGAERDARRCGRGSDAQADR